MDDTNELRRSIIEREIDKQLFTQKDGLREAIMQGCKETDSYEEIYTKMIINSTMASVKITAMMIMEMLFDTGVWTPRSEDELRKNIFSVVNGKKNGDQQKKD